MKSLINKKFEPLSRLELFKLTLLSIAGVTRLEQSLLIYAFSRAKLARQ